MDEAERLCDTLIVIDHGRKITEGSPRELIAEHIEPQVIEVFDELRGQLAPSSKPTAAWPSASKPAVKPPFSTAARRSRCWPNWLKSTACATCIVLPTSKMSSSLTGRELRD